MDALDERAVDEHADAVAATAGTLDISFNLITHSSEHGTPLAEMALEDVGNVAASWLPTARGR